MKRTIVLAVLGWALLASCSKNPTNPQDKIDLSDLSAEGSANCYVLSEAGTYHFDGTVKGNGATTEGITLPTGLPTQSAGLIWESAKGMIKDISFDGINIHFTFDGTHGNALIGALDKDGNIVWSWHIWAPKDRLEAFESKTGHFVANMNIGALISDFHDTPSAEAYGMLYQWGRKDPLPSAATLTGDLSTIGAPLYDADGQEVKIANSSWTDTKCNTLEYSIAHPTVCLSNYAHSSNTKDWLIESEGNDHLWADTKTIFDPCPVGYKVPSAAVFKTFTTSGGYTVDPSAFDVADISGDGIINADDFTYGWHFNLKDKSLLFPAAARYDGSYAMLMGSKSGLWGTYWANSAATGTTTYKGMADVALTFMVEGKNIATSAAAYSNKADAYSVRCVKQ